MKIGICFGGYCPLHQGHLDLIMKSKKENDVTAVFVCGYDGEERGDGYGLPLIKRFRIISNFLADGDLVKTFMINDTELGLDESMSESNWDIWIAEVYKQIGKAYAMEFALEVAQVKWYVAEFAYACEINRTSRNYPFDITVELANRTKNPISGTAIRENPLKYWDKIALPFKPYFCHNILIAGTASEGKTTLTHDIGKYFGLPYSYEKGRDIYKGYGKTDKEFDFKDFMYNIYEQRKINEEIICSAWNPGIILSDSDNLVTLMYAYFYAKREGFAISAEQYEILHNVAIEYAKTTKWNKIFLIKPKEKGIVDDGERYMPDSDYQIRLEFYEYLKQLYIDFGYEFEELDGSYYENFIRVKNYINEIKGE